MTAPHHTRYAAIYARVSTEDQAKGYSLPNQLEACQKLAEHEGYTVQDAQIFCDDLTGEMLNRPGFMKVRELVAAKAITAVIVYDVDRLSRKMAHQLLFEEECDQAGVALLVVTDPIEAGPEGALKRHIKGAFAEWEKAKILKRTRDGTLRRARAGHPWGGQVPLGYRAVREPHKARWEIEEEVVALVRRIFALCLSGTTTYGISEQLTKERVPTCRERSAQGGRRRVLRAGVWQASSIQRLLTNTAYVGRAYFGKSRHVTKTTRVRRPPEEWIELSVPAIIDEQTFEAVQRQLAHNREQSPRNRRRSYLLAGGRFRCGRCGRTMCGTAPRGTRRYNCSSMNFIRDPEARCRGSVKADEVERQVWDAVARVLEQPELIAAEVKQQQSQADAQRAKIEQACALIEASLAKCDREAQRWADAYAGEVINLAELKAYRAEIDHRRRGLLAEQADCQAQLETIGYAVQRVEALTDYCVRVRQQLQTFEEAEKRVAFEALNIRVNWRPGEPLAIQGSIPLRTIAPIPAGRYTA